MSKLSISSSAEEPSSELKAIDPFKPPIGVLIKLGSIAVHVEEMLSPSGHAFDKIALQSLLEDPEVVAWVAKMDKLAMLPKKR